jgi:HEPN domain-containing protein
MSDLSKRRLIELAEAKLADAKLLLADGRSGNAYYLAGYAVELLLKALLSSRFRADTIPDPIWLKDVFTHNLERLLKLAQLDDDLKQRSDVDDEFKGRWDIVLEWNETSRYYVREQRDAEALIEAIDDPQYGAFQWLKERL